MRNFTESEICMLLLSAMPGEERPVRDSLYRRLSHAASALQPSEAVGELTLEELLRLGCDREEGENILWRLEQRDALHLYLTNLEEKGIFLTTRISPDYPAMLRERLGERSPLVLYCTGNPELLQKKCISLVGSRKLREKGSRFARKMGALIAREGYVYCSGGAEGADSEGFLAATDNGGSAILFLPDSLLKAMETPAYKRLLKEGRLLLVSLQGYDLPFTPVRALDRNRLIHAMGEKVLVAQSDYGSGGTWRGVMDNLKESWSSVYICNDEPEDAGTKGLSERGCIPVETDRVRSVHDLVPIQKSLFEP